MVHDEFSNQAELSADGYDGNERPRGKRRRRQDESNPRDDIDRRDDVADVEEPLVSPVMKITQPALHSLLDYLLTCEPEAAGLLVGPKNDDVLVTDFVPDLTGRGTPGSFELGTDALNDLLKRIKPAGINCKGIAHSHPAGIAAPSHGDLIYLRRIFGLPGNSAAVQFYMPIVCGGRLYPYVYTQGRVWRAELVLV